MKCRKFARAAGRAVLYIAIAASPAWVANAIQGATLPIGNLIMYHDFEDNYNDGAANGATHDGTAFGGAAFSGDVPNATAGSSSVLFDGSTGVVEFANGGDLDMNTGSPFTITLWIKPNSNTDGQAIFAKSPTFTDGSTNTPALVYKANGKLQYDVFYKGSTETFTGIVSIGNWSHLAFIYTGSEYQLYVNGAPESLPNDFNLNGQGANEGADWRFTIGDSYNTGVVGDDGPTPPNLFNGNIDELTFWNVALDGAQVAEIFANGVVIPEPASSLLGVSILGILWTARRRRR